MLKVGMNDIAFYFVCTHNVLRYQSISKKKEIQERWRAFIGQREEERENFVNSI